MPSRARREKFSLVPRALPSLNALYAFEAAARHLSLVRAARELHVTPSAVSHQVRALESSLGRQLFERLPRALRLTSAGEQVAAAAAEAFDGLERRLRRLPRRGRQTLTVSVVPSFAAGWLVGRLPRFQEDHPAVELRLHASQALVDLAAGEADLAIRYGPGRYAGLKSERLLDEVAFPVCAPEAAARLSRPEALKGEVLLHDEARGAHGGWPAWLALAGVRSPRWAERGPRFSDARLLLQAAAAGQGVALCRSVTAYEELAAGRLVRPFEPQLPCRWHYALVWTAAAARRPQVRAFAAFLRREAQRGTSSHPSSTPASTGRPR